MDQEIEKKYVLFQGGGVFASQTVLSHFGDMLNLRDTVMRTGVKIRQGYLPVDIGMEIANTVGGEVTFEPTEARLRHEGSRYYLTLKSDGDLVRPETPDIEVSDTVFELYWDFANRRLEKTRLEVPQWGAEIDVYSDRSLVTAEIEVGSVEEAQRVQALGRDVTNDPDYKNRSLAQIEYDRQFVLTGGPRSGKSATIDYLSALQYPTIPESARIVIDEELKKGGSIVPWENFTEFQLEVLKRSNIEAEALKGWGTKFYDRGLADGIAYCIASDMPVPTPLADAVRKSEYKGVFILESLPFMNDEVRRETPEEAQRIHETLHRTYADLGYSPVSVPVDLTLEKDESIRQRAHFIVDHSHTLH